MRLTTARYSSLVSGIYAAALDESLWTDVMEDIGSATGSAATAFLSTQPKIQRQLSCGAGKAKGLADVPYNAYYHQFDPVAAALENTNPGALLLSRVLLTEGHRRSEFCNDWLDVHDIGDAIFAGLTRDAESTCALVVAGPWQLEPFPTAQRLELVRLLIPHLQQAFLARQTLEEAQRRQAFCTSTLDHLRAGVLILTAEGKVAYFNAAAEKIARVEDGMTIRPDGLHTLRRHDERRLQAAFAQARQQDRQEAPRGQAVSIERPSGKRPYLVQVLPMPDRAGFDSRRNSAQEVLVLMVDPERESPLVSPALLRQLFDLTPAEAAVAVLAAGGIGLQATAEQLGVSISTARIHLQRVFEKTQTHRQAQLVRLVLELQAGLRLQN